MFLILSPGIKIYILFDNYNVYSFFFSLIMLIYYQNVNELRKKTNSFYINSSFSKYDITVLNETNLNKSVLNGELFNNYNESYKKRRDLSITD